MKQKITLKNLGLAIEGIGVTLTGFGVEQLSRGWIIAGMLTSAIGRAAVIVGR